MQFIEDLRTDFVLIGTLQLKRHELRRLEPDYPSIESTEYVRREYNPTLGYHGLLRTGARGEDMGELPWGWGEYVIRREGHYRRRLEQEAAEAAAIEADRIPMPGVDYEVADENASPGASADESQPAG